MTLLNHDKKTTCSLLGSCDSYDFQETSLINKILRPFIGSTIASMWYSRQLLETIKVLLRCVLSCHCSTYRDIKHKHRIKTNGVTYWLLKAYSLCGYGNIRNFLDWKSIAKLSVASSNENFIELIMVGDLNAAFWKGRLFQNNIKVIIIIYL